ncbi:MAG TPA: hypothetical protein VGQ85_06640 [Candidatus Limnocylindrales bacterium]|nr:hypothetical protein [Candidatus Limnocylindrales bacterium]
MDGEEIAVADGLEGGEAVAGAGVPAAGGADAVPAQLATKIAASRKAALGLIGSSGSFRRDGATRDTAVRP